MSQSMMPDEHVFWYRRKKRGGGDERELTIYSFQRRGEVKLKKEEIGVGGTPPLFLLSWGKRRENSIIRSKKR